jgi:transcriptional regulator with PAS, ATPase and Fis domain
MFGAQRGAYSGADANVDGYVSAAHGGTLFLDEIAELELTVQAKLLRVLETKEVMPLGATRARKVDFQLCAATLKDLRAEVAAGRFREDLYHRVGRPEVRIPSLRERLEEVPWIVTRALRNIDERLAVTASFVEACLLRDWHGNVRELLREMQEAALSANADARNAIYAADLSTLDVDGTPAGPTQSGMQRGIIHTREAILEALHREAGNVSGAARKLGMHRTQLRRWLATNGFDISVFRDPSEPPPVPAVVQNSPDDSQNDDAD